MKLIIIISALLLAACVSAQVDGSVRLVNGTNYNSSVGRVEVYSGGSWYSVCADDSLCSNAAEVVCRQLGYVTAGAEVYGLALYGQGSGTVGFQNVSCTGYETNVTQCNYTTPSTCPHSMDAAVKCYSLADSVCYQYLGVTGCCTGFPCYVASQGFCYCDITCHFFGDCCGGIDLTCPLGGGGGSVGGEYCSSAQSGTLSFVDGVGSSGRLRICDSNEWKTVCSKGFDENEARVACASFGYSPTNFTIYSASQYGQGQDTAIYEKDLRCTGSEGSLTSCVSNDTCCGHHHDVGLQCQPSCADGQIRLVGGATPMEGRVEVCYQGRWGTVCDDSWGINDARVACRMAGFPWTGTVQYSGYYTTINYGQGVGPIWLDDLACSGSENSLFNCSGNAVGVHNCGHYEDASVKCAAGPCDLAGINTCCDPTTTNCQGNTTEGVCHCSADCEEHGDCCIDYSLTCGCNNYDIRLRGGTVPNEGRVEMCYNNEWGTVCDDFWGTPDAKVVCRQLGYDPTSAQSFSFSYFGQGSGSIWLDNVHCSGTETHLINCTANAIGSHNCIHYEDAGVRCTIPDAPVCTHGQARLARGPSEFEGQLEVCYNGQWGTVCDDFFSQVDARVACRNMFPTMPASGAIFIQYSYQYFGFSDLDILMDNVHCSGDEQYLVNCSHITSHNCAHFEDVGIACYPPGTYDGQVSLNPGPTAGRLMMYTSNSWGTVCRNSFGMEEATVVCRELGLPTVSPRIYLNLQFQRGYGDIKRRLLSCTGNETHLVNCTNSYTYCSHYSDVGVGCEEGCASGAIRLLDGANSTEGRVEVCRDGAWGTICDDDVSWGSEEARVVCRQLGLPYSAAQSKYFGPGPGPFHYSSFGCNGDEVSLETCDRDTTPSCYSHTQDVGVVCQEACTAGEVRLVNGQSNYQGRLEVCIGGLWGTVCDNQFHNVDAQVVCKQLGLPYAGAEAKHNAYFGQGSDHIALTSLYCTGSETQLFSCNFQTGSAVTCGHSNDVGVICQDVCANGALRVAGADLDNAGRLEVCYNAEWGTICDKGWDNLDVQVACYQLGFNKSFVRSFGGSKYGPGFGSIYFRDMGCQGTESKLQFCTSSTDTDDCDHTDDAGLQCNGARLLPTATPTSIPILPPPSPVTNVTFVIVNATYAYVSWDEPFQANGVITGYTVTINSMSSTQRGNDPRQYHFTNLNAGVPYTYSITASNIFGNSSAYTQQFFTAELAPNTKVAMTGRRVDENTISMMWTPLNLMQARGEVTGYTIMWSEYGGASTNTWTQSFTADQSSYTIATNVMPSKQYIFDIYATNRIGNGPRLPYVEQIIVPTTSSAILQLKFALSSGQLCGTYTSTSSSTKLTDIINAVISQVKTGCNGCTFTRDYIFNERFKCNPQEDETDQVTFRAQFVSPGTTTNTTILRIIDSWLSSPDTVPTVSIAGVEYALDSNCQSSIGSFDADYCVTSRAGAGTGVSIGIGVGVTIGAVAVFAIMAVVLVFILVFVRRTKIKYAADSSGAVGYSNRMAFPEGNEDNISQHMGSTVHDDDFQEALHMITENMDDKSKLAAADQGHVYMNVQ